MKIKIINKLEFVECCHGKGSQIFDDLDFDKKNMFDVIAIIINRKLLTVKLSYLIVLYDQLCWLDVKKNNKVIEIVDYDTSNFKLYDVVRCEAPDIVEKWLKEEQGIIPTVFNDVYCEEWVAKSKSFLVDSIFNEKRAYKIYCQEKHVKNKN